MFSRIRTRTARTSVYDKYYFNAVRSGAFRRFGQSYRERELFVEYGVFKREITRTAVRINARSTNQPIRRIPEENTTRFFAVREQIIFQN